MHGRLPPTQHGWTTHTGGGCTPAGTCGRGVELSCVPPLGGEDRRRQCPGPDHLVLTRPLTNRPRPKAALIAGGMFACAERVATATKLFVILSSSKISLKVSAVRPEGPGAAPLRARRTLARRVAAGRLVGLAGWNWRTCSGIGWYGWAGRRAGSRSSCKVASVWGAKGPAVSACRAADSSPWWTSWRARRACCWAVGACSVGVLLLVVLSCAARSRASHSPAWKAVIRACHSGLGSVHTPVARWSNMRGRRSQSFHARTLCCCVSACCMAAKARPKA